VSLGSWRKGPAEGIHLDPQVVPRFESEGLPLGSAVPKEKRWGCPGSMDRSISRQFVAGEGNADFAASIELLQLHLLRSEQPPPCSRTVDPFVQIDWPARSAHSFQSSLDKLNGEEQKAGHPVT
jgi:hypothetical protein